LPSLSYFYLMDDLSFKLSVISICFSGFSFAIGIACLKYIKGYCIPLMLVVTIGFLVDGANLILTQEQVSNLFIFHFYTPIEFTLWVIFYFLFFKEHFKNYIVFFILLPLFYIVCFLDYKINGFDSYDNLSSSIESIILSIISLYSFWTLMKTRIYKKLWAVPFFYINSGILLYFSGNLLFFVFENIVIKSTLLWELHSLLNILFNILIGIAFWKSRTT
jgi:hypothetical protein